MKKFKTPLERRIKSLESKAVIKNNGCSDIPQRITDYSGVLPWEDLKEIRKKKNWRSK